MIEEHDLLYKDLEAVKQIPIVETMLDVVCQLTGLGFAAIARVTEDRWLACSVKDLVNFGLKQGEELKIETTLCNEIRGHKKAIVIDHVDKDEIYSNHHTPKMYGLQSYISFPIILKNGEFFGTLCAIGTKPAVLNDSKIIGTFTLFSELIAFHLQSLDLITRSHSALKETSKQLIYTTQENQLYQKISSHNLKEPLHKLEVYSDMLMNHVHHKDEEKIKKSASRIHSSAKELKNMINHLTKFSELQKDEDVMAIDLSNLLSVLKTELKNDLKEKKIVISQQDLPMITGVASQINQLFSQLIQHVISFSKDAAVHLHIYSRPDTENNQAAESDYCEIIFEIGDNGEKTYYADTLFDMFIHTDKANSSKYAPGLAYCRKIVQNHGGTIKMLQGKNLSLSISLPRSTYSLDTVRDF